ncbi:hypothetical protein M406DRAFT_75142 [Cryphonectria parasitica EP155]|uniref:Uncharacterized protein n=1 Tax=Cryphonectria parasitica (strain ATCC 38755 / EP155) TaxID=660469 RepID=A0A9P5CN97_CRYP1|nr:uncharacterized protein M406DRAFT_75142 [Cryphonectria parasitica EP155]KAF3763911.1 hypothetical protein M406DRAFT_75142 [Cryphonectria parasitica EP155]
MSFRREIVDLTAPDPAHRPGGRDSLGAFERDYSRESSATLELQAEDITFPSSIVNDQALQSDQDDGRTQPPPRKMRIRGACLASLGMLYPGAKMALHRIGNPLGPDFEITGSTLFSIRALVDQRTTFRMTMVRPDEPTETYIGWSAAAFGQERTADDFCGILQLGKSGIGRLMMFTVHTDEQRGWVVARQVPGRDYDLQACLEIMNVPSDFRPMITGFGPERWTNGEAIPQFYVGKDLGLNNVTGKIRDIMRDG